MSQENDDHQGSGSETEAIDDLRNHIKEQLLSANPILRDDRTALHRAAASKLEGVVARLLTECPFLINEEQGGAATLHFAAREGHSALVSQLLAVNPALAVVRADYDWTALHFAAEGGHEAIVAQLLAVNPASQIDAVTNVGWTALHWAAATGHAAIVTQLLAAKPALVDARTNNGWTALHLAVHARHEETVAQLLKATKTPASIEATTDEGQTVLQLAANHEGITAQLIAAHPGLLDEMVNDNDSWNALRNVVELGHEEAMERVLAKHLPNLIDEKKCAYRGWTVFHYAAWYGRDKFMSQLLATVIQPDLERLLLRKSTGNFRGTSAATALHMGAMKGYCNIVAQLLASCPALIDVLDGGGRTCLQFAVCEPFTSSSSSSSEQSHKSQEAVVDYLLAVKPALIRAVDAKGNTILHSILTHHPRKEFVKKLWKLNPEALLTANKLGQTPFSIAVGDCNDSAIDLVQWSLTFEQIEKTYHKLFMKAKKIMAVGEREEFRARFVERFKPLLESQCEELAVELLPDVVALVFEYLGLSPKGQSRPFF